MSSEKGKQKHGRQTKRGRQVQGEEVGGTDDASTIDRDLHLFDSHRFSMHCTVFLHAKNGKICIEFPNRVGNHVADSADTQAARTVRFIPPLPTLARNIS